MAKREPKKNLKRNIKKLKPKRRILIVCEGKTEKLYFACIKKKFKLYEITEILTPHNNASSPISVVDFAIQKYTEDKKINGNDSYDNVYCLIDRDEHESYHRAVYKINRMNNENLKTYTSNPCFEYWLLLHFKFSDKPYSATFNKSKGDNVIKDLKKFIANYNKVNEQEIDGLLKNLKMALKHAEKSYSMAKKRDDKNP